MNPCFHVATWDLHLFSLERTQLHHPYNYTPPTHSRLLTFKRHNSRKNVGMLTFKASTTYCPSSWRPEGESTDSPWPSQFLPIHQQGRVSSRNSKNEICASGRTPRVSCPSGDGHFMGIHSINCQNWVVEKETREWKWGATNWWRYWGEGVPQMPTEPPACFSPRTLSFETHPALSPGPTPVTLTLLPWNFFTWSSHLHYDSPSLSSLPVWASHSVFPV